MKTQFVIYDRERERFGYQSGGIYRRLYIYECVSKKKVRVGQDRAMFQMHRRLDHFERNFFESTSYL